MPFVRRTVLTATLALAACGGDQLPPVDSGNDVPIADASIIDVTDAAIDRPAPIDVLSGDPPSPDSGTDATSESADVIDAASDATGDASNDAIDVHTTDAPADAPIDASADAPTDASIDALRADADAAALDASVDVASDAPIVDAGPPWRHTIVIDGQNDFLASSESFATTSPGYTAYLSWDANNLFVGYNGADVSSGSTTKWIFAFIDVDPGTGVGATSGPMYNTEVVGFPTGFAPEFYVRWRASNDFQSIERFQGGTWSTLATAMPTTRQNGNYVEIGVPLAALGRPARIGVTTLMMNEAPNVEAAYAGIYSNNFTDGYHPRVPLTAYVQVDFASALAPNDPANRRP